jgi:hypothetical protein
MVAEEKAHMTKNEFRRIALSLPNTSESAHMSHPDFRVQGKIFATMGYPDQAWAMVKLTPEQQEELVRAEPMVFTPLPGSWGRTGATGVRLKAAKKASLRAALAAAWCNRAPRSLARQFESRLWPRASVRPQTRMKQNGNQ